MQQSFVFLKFYMGFHLYGQEHISFELEKLRTELRHARGMYAIVQSETIDASLKVNVCFLLSTTKFYKLLFVSREWFFKILDFDQIGVLNSSNGYLFVVFYSFII